MLYNKLKWLIIPLNTIKLSFAVSNSIKQIQKGDFKSNNLELFLTPKL